VVGNTIQTSPAAAAIGADRSPISPQPTNECGPRATERGANNNHVALQHAETTAPMIVITMTMRACGSRPRCAPISAGRGPESVVKSGIAPLSRREPRDFPSKSGPNLASWNQIVPLLRRIDLVRCAA
jgi:hypothetical protein